MDDPTTATGFLRFSDAEYQRRFGSVRAMLRDLGLDGLLLFDAGRRVGPIHYLSNFIAFRPTWLLFPLDGPPALLLTYLNHVPCAEAMSIVKDVSCFRPSAPKAVAAKIAERGLDCSRVGVCGTSTIPYAHYQQLQSLLPHLELVDVSAQYNKIRWIRSEEELARLRQAADLCDAMCEFLSKQIKPGITEYDLQQTVHEAFLPKGGHLGISFIATTSMENPDRCSPWEFMTGRRLSRGDVVITELTASYWGYSGQIHRSFSVGTEPTPLYQRLFQTALECYEAVRQVTVPGATSEEVTEATKMVTANGFRLFDSILHGEGGQNPEIGGAGSDHSHEAWRFEENQVMVIQPNPITADKRAGLQVGCAVRVAPGGADPLHSFPFEFRVCG